MFDRFTKEARQAVMLAVGEARDRQDGRVGSEHLLIGVFGTAGPGSPIASLGPSHPSPGLQEEGGSPGIDATRFDRVHATGLLSPRTPSR
jgi:hypothetical protein